MRTTLRTRLTAALLVPIAAVAMSACGSSEPTGLGTIDPVNPPTTAVVTTDAVPNDDATAPDAPVANSTIAARLGGTTEVYAEPSQDAQVVTTIGATTELGSVSTLLVVDQQEDWIEVALPIRPNGATGWIPTAAAELRGNTYRIHVDLEARTLSLMDGETVLVETPVAIGSNENPTPAGTYFVTDLVDTGDAAGAYGPFAFGLSGHSETLSEFGGGDGQLGIHGTNDPSSIGEAVSHGCVRVPNETIAQMVDLVPLGTPVTVV